MNIVFVGAGSVEFTWQLLRDIFSFPELGGVRIALHDIDAERLSVAEALQYLAGIAPALKAAGLCHSVYWTVRDLCEIVGVPYEEADVVSAGVNHQAWILRWQRQGRDLYPALDAAIAADPELRRRVRVDMYKRLGYYPTETSDSEYVPWYLRHDAKIDRLRIPVDDYVRISADNLAEYASGGLS